MTKKNREMTFEERMARLQAIVTALEAGDSPLEQSVALYREGLAHAAACREQIAAARHEVEVCDEGVLFPLDPDENDPRGGEDGEAGGAS